MKVIYTAIICIFWLAGAGQGSPENSNRSLPAIVRPSPTVAQLMKVEESQLDHFTGQPQISLPLSSIKSGKLEVSLSLSYNSSGIRVSETSGWVGKGWVLNAGGVISRSVIDLPDETNNAIQKGADYNYYHEMYRPGFDPESEERKEFSYDVQWGTSIDLDSKNDIYQFNFMGKTGRFVFTKRFENILKPVIIGDDADYKIEPVYVNTASPYYPTEIASFTITDGSGYKYYFTEKERTEKKDFTLVNTQAGCGSPVAPQLAPLLGKFISAWHLSRVEDENGQELFSIAYADVLEKPRAALSQTSYFVKTPMPPSDTQSCDQHMACALKPQTITSLPLRDIDSKKISRITFRDNSYIQFALSASHPEYIEGKGAYLTGISIYDGQSPLPAKTFDFIYSGDARGLFLDKVKANGSESDGYAFEYFEKDQYPEYSYSDPSSRDMFGYPNIGDAKESMSTGVLTKIIYPTKGAREFVWEPNTYSYKGDKLLSWREIFNNPDNYTIDNQGISDTHVNSYILPRPHQIFHVNLEQDARVITSTSSTGFFDFPQSETVRIQPVLSDYSTPDTSRETIMYGININQTLYSTIRLKPGAYKVYFMNSLNLQISNGENVISGNVTIGVKNPKQNINWFLYGGGIRIKTIKDSDRVAYQAVKGFKYNLENPGIVPADLPPALSLSHPNGIPAYSLAFSSGSFDGIASLIKKYSISVQPIFNQFFIPATDSPVIDYDVEEKQSELDVQLARGSFIGYKNVFEYVYPNNSELQGAIFKSKIKRSFDSAIDFPSTFYSPPSALPVISEEYKHGNLRKIEYFNASLGLVLSEDFKYNYDSSEIRTLSAKNFYAVGNENFFSGFCQQVRVLFTSWHNLKSNFISAAQYETTCDGTSSLLPQLFLDLDKSSCLLNLAGAFVCVDDFRHKVQVTEHIKKEYFPGGTIIHQENYAYRDNYKRLFSKISVLPSGETLENRYYYSQDPEMASAPMRNELAARNMVSMPLREEYYRNGGLLSSSETRYGSFTPAGSVQPGYVLPQYIYAGKGNSLERKAIFSSYDDKGNILEQAPENGVSASFIWGFRKSLPVAKIENMAYSSIPANLILAVQAASDAVPYSEQNLLAALEALRTSPALSGAIATTYTYKPLIGPSTVTDSKGMKTSYEYDSFGRLESVRGNEGSILSENKYHYRPQN